MVYRRCGNGGKPPEDLFWPVIIGVAIFVALMIIFGGK